MSRQYGLSIILTFIISLVCFPTISIAQTKIADPELSRQEIAKDKSKPIDNLDFASKIAQIVTGTGTLAILCLTLFLTLKSNKSAKQADTLMECNRRFDRLWEVIYASSNSISPEAFYERFWSLQFDQFTYRRLRYIEDSTFRFWMKSRYEEWVKNDNHVGGLKYQDAWNNVKHHWTHDDFIEFMDLNTPDSFGSGCKKAIHRIECRCKQNTLHPMDSLKNIVTGLLSTAGHFTNLSEPSY